TLQAEVIYQKAEEMACLKGDEKVLDLYCGTGSVVIFASGSATQVLGIELVAEAVDDARLNWALNGVDNMEVWNGDVERKLDELAPPPDGVIVDPPRAGLGSKTIAHLARLKPKKIIYISCNPVSQAEDCAALADKGYEIQALQPIDQFPHTHHV